MELVFRCVKALLVGAVMFFSLRSLGVPVEQSVALSLIPLLLGTLDLLTAFAYSLSGVVLIVACGYNFLAGYHLHPDNLHTIVAAWLK